MPPHGAVERHDDQQASFHDEDGPLLTLATVYTVPVRVVLARPEPVVSTSSQPPGPRRVERLQTKFDVPIHGPPRAPNGLRAPPLAPAS
jgi:hypothetical protein